MYAVIDDRGKQYKVGEGDHIRIDRREVEAGAKIEFDRVLLVSREDDVRVGAPTVPNAKVTAVVEGEEKGEKVISMKFRRAKDSRRRIGHRQKYTAVRIIEILVG